MTCTMGAGADTPTQSGGPAATTLADVASAVGAEVLWCTDLTASICGVVAADLMSDVLVDSQPGFVLVTGLMNVQVIRTAAISDLAAVVFARGKAVPADVLGLAREMNVPVFAVRTSLFEAAGRLFDLLKGRAAGSGSS
jgi:hypothetical protein